MIGRLPVLATSIVLAAVAVMVWLGIWQLDRAQWKNDLLDRYRTAHTLSADMPFPRNPAEVEQALYRHATVDCLRVSSLDVISGRNAQGVPGWAHAARCQMAGGTVGDVVLGWSSRPEVAQWNGGPVSGVLGPGRDGEARLIASPPQAGLQANALPDPAELPNNHLSYAVQWFLFAGTALVIYLLALRRKWRGAAGRGD